MKIKKKVSLGRKSRSKYNIRPLDLLNVNLTDLMGNGTKTTG